MYILLDLFHLKLYQKAPWNAQQLPEAYCPIEPEGRKLLASSIKNRYMTAVQINILTKNKCYQTMAS